MAWAGTLPENAYFKELIPIQGPVRRPSKNPHPTVENEVDQTNEVADDVEEIPQYESKSDMEVVMMEVRLTINLFALIEYQMLRLK